MDKCNGNPASKRKFISIYFQKSYNRLAFLKPFLYFVRHIWDLIKYNKQFKT